MLFSRVWVCSGTRWLTSPRRSAPASTLQSTLLWQRDRRLLTTNSGSQNDRVLSHSQQITDVIAKIKISEDVPRIFSSDVDVISRGLDRKEELVRVINELTATKSTDEKMDIYRRKIAPEGSNAKWHLIEEIYNDRKKRKLPPTDFVAGWVARAFVKQQKKHMLGQVFRDFVDYGIAPSSETLGVLLRFCDQTKQFDLATQLYAAMIRMHGQPDTASYNVMIRICVKMKRLDDAIRYAEENLRRANPLGITRDTREQLSSHLRFMNPQQKTRFLWLLSQHATIDQW